jgi:membrane-bound lytic murein transglycosylase D
MTRSFLPLARQACVFGLLLAACSLQAQVQDSVSSPQNTAQSEPVAPILEPIREAQLSSDPVATLTTPADLWERIRRGFAMPDLQTELVTDRETWYSARPDYMQRMAERSSKYLFHIVEELERRNMPTELALLPFIESAFNPQAVSVAKAAGMWQFMPATGKFFELKQNAFRDDRRDVLASTRAALDYLQKLYNMFGDWHLALAAYNWGEGSVARAIAKNQRTGLATGYTDLSMPQETRYYVPKLQAVKNLVARPHTLANALPNIPNHPFFQTVDIQRDIDVSLAARLAEVSLDDFKALNPSVNRPVILAAGTPQILLPWDNAAIFENNLQRRSDGQLASWTVWIPASTMTPAEAARRVGMPEADLRRVNEIPARVVIKAGSTLLVPRSARLDQDVASHVADAGQIALAPEVQLQRRLLKAGRADSVSSIARKYGVSPQNLAVWNKVSPSASFKPGQQIVVMLPAPAARPVAQARKAPAKAVKVAAAKKPAPVRSGGVKLAKR